MEKEAGRSSRTEIDCKVGEGAPAAGSSRRGCTGTEEAGERVQGKKVEQQSSSGFRLEKVEHEEQAETEKTGEGSSSDRAAVCSVAGDDTRSG